MRLIQAPTLPFQALTAPLTIATEEGVAMEGFIVLAVIVVVAVWIYWKRRSWVVPLVIVIARVALVGSLGLAALLVGATVVSILSAPPQVAPHGGGWGSQSGWAVAGAIFGLGVLLPIAGGSWFLLKVLTSERAPAAQ